MADTIRRGMKIAGFAKGARFDGPNGMGYELTRQILCGDVSAVRAADFIPYGGAPQPIDGAEMPHWLAMQLGEVFS